MDTINMIMGIILTIGAFLFAYMSSVIVAEKKLKKRIPLFWEKEWWQKED